MNMTIRDWNIESMTGYKPITTTYTDFSIAEKFGTKAITETFNKLFREWKKDGYYKELTELCMALNWKEWEHADNDNKELCCLYDSLWRKCDAYCCDHLKGDELTYFFRTTD